MSFFSYICLRQVILLRSFIWLCQVVLYFAQFKGKYNITETKGFNITFDLQKYHSNEVGISLNISAFIMYVKVKKYRSHEGAVFF